MQKLSVKLSKRDPRHLWKNGVLKRPPPLISTPERANSIGSFVRTIYWKCRGSWG